MRFMIHTLIINQCFCKQWYEQSAQLLNMTLRQVKSLTEQTFNLNIYYKSIEYLLQKRVLEYGYQQ